MHGIIFSALIRKKEERSVFSFHRKVNTKFFGSSVLEMLLRLRQCCDHVALVADAHAKMSESDAAQAQAQAQALRRAQVGPAHEDNARCGVCFDRLDHAETAACCGQPFCHDCIAVYLLSIRGTVPFSNPLFTNISLHIFCRNYRCTNGLPFVQQPSQ